MKKLATVLVLFGMLLQAAPAPAAGDDVVIPVILSMTGSIAFVGQKLQASLRVIEASINAAGGIKGRKVRFEYGDDESNPQVAVQLVSALAAKKVPLIFGPIFAPTCQAVAPLIDTAGPVMYCLSPNIFPRANGYMFMSAPSIEDVQPVLFRYLLKRKLTKIALVVGTDASGVDFEKRVDTFIAQPEFKDLRVIDREHFAVADLSVAAQISRIKAAGPDVLLSFSVGSPFGTLLKGIHDVGLEVPVFASGGNFLYSAMQQWSSILPKEIFMNGARGITPDAIATGAVKRAQQEYATAATKAGLRLEFIPMIPWDPMHIVVEALRRAGPDTDAQKLWSTLQSMKGYSGIEGTYDFTTRDQRGLREASAALFQYDQTKDQFVQIAPAR
jgi:branched-chain amino acid transport system substrate-binding protein